jgi:adenylate cyclase, class 2
MAGGFEREIKLKFDNAADARSAVTAAGGRPKRARRLQQDALLDTEDGTLRSRGSALRVRVEDNRAILTFKGPVHPSTMKLREEIETEAGAPAVLFTIFERLGYRVWFRYEKFREEFTLENSIVAVDETPVGTYVEIEGDERAIGAAARALGRTPDQYLVDSYRALHERACEERGSPQGDMIFPRTDQPA